MTITQNQRHLEHRTFRFPGGETQFKLITDSIQDLPVNILCRIHSGDDVMELLMAVDALERAGIYAENSTLELPYLPYARQDRVMMKGEAFSLKVFTRLVNSLNFGTVKTFDPHSDVGPALLEHCIVIDSIEAASKYIQTNVGALPFVLISPDAGAYKKTAKLAEKLNVDVVVATKTRNVTDGKLAPPKVLGDVEGKVCVIVDDICDGGRTFINLADALVASGAAETHLFVSHGIFSNGFDELFKRFKTIGTTDSFKPEQDFPKNIQVINITN